MEDIKYDSMRPLMRLNKGDSAIIKVKKPPFISTENKEKYKHVPDGEYHAICVGKYHLECSQYPILSGKYTYWYGHKWGCSGVIYADEVDIHKKEF